LAYSILTKIYLLTYSLRTFFNESVTPKIKLFNKTVFQKTL